MTTWTNIDTARLEPGKPARSIDVIALRDNPIAIAEGAENAPRIVTAALISPVAGDDVVGILYGTSASAGGSTSSSSGAAFFVLVSGVIRVIASVSVSNAYSQVAIGQIRKNGVSIASRSTSGALSVDVAVVRGDSITSYAYASSVQANLSASASVSGYVHTNEANFVGF